MDSLYRTPLLDCFKRGDIAPDIRMMAAEGILAPRAHEQLGLLVLLADDPDPGIRAATESTLRRLPVRDLARFLGRGDLAPEIVAFFKARGVEPERGAGASSDDPLVGADDGGAARGDVREDPDEAREAGRPTAAAGLRLSSMTVPEKIKTAMRGTREERAILIRDPNKIVAFSVLSSPKLSEQDIEGFAGNAGLSEDVLRVIATTRAWCKNYSIVRALVFNPKTPIAISMSLVNRLVERDVRMLALDRNVAEPVRLLARKSLQTGRSRRG
ncbi:MAG TPA: hypothetical protein PLN93_06905 [Vicinamibacterales bacterium]|nr:hypothetical protein [Vicinamibacterales bacterium]HPK71653.1 hypothetical protein [Vicinamibacterales bacterium]